MFKPDPNKSYRMPVYFGGGEPLGPDAELYMHDTTSLTVTFATDRQRLEAFLPEGFELLAPELSVSFTSMREIDWMAGGFYNLVQVQLPVRFTGKRDRLDGILPLVVWENKTAPILGGREESGIPKIFADIQDLHIMPTHYYTNASHEGYTFLKMGMRNPVEVPEQDLGAFREASKIINTIGWRFIPKVDGTGADLSQFILYPQGFQVGRAWIGEGEIRWTELTWEENPMQYHIIKALADLPVREMRPASMAKGVCVLKPSQGRLLE